MSHRTRNSQFDHLRKPSDGTCWWCGAIADSKEHKYKRTDLAKLQGGGEALVWGSEDEINHKVRSIRKSDAVRFSKSLCRKCNGNRSQPFDRSYDIYVDFLWEHSAEMWDWEGIPMEEVFGKDWPITQLNLARYFAKHFGCRIAEEGLPVPPSIISFMNGSTSVPHIGMFFTKHEDVWELRKGLQHIDSKMPGLWLGGMQASMTSDLSRVVFLRTNTLVGYIGVELIWNEKTPEIDSFFPHVLPLLNRVDVDPSVLAMIREVNENPVHEYQQKQN